MLQISFIRKNKEEILLGLEKRNFPKKNLIDDILNLDKKKKKVQYNFNKILKIENKISKEIGILLKRKKNEEVDKIHSLKMNSLFLKEKKKNLYFQLKNIIDSLEDKLNKIPNIPNKLVKKDFKEEDILFQEGDLFHLKMNKPLFHWELSKKFHLFDLFLGTKICGSGFAVYIGKGAKLQRSLIQYFLDKNIQASYKEYSLPYLIQEKSGYSTGQIPDKEGQMYFIEKDHLYLIPTGEIPLMNCYRDNLLNYNDLPIKSTTYTSCFRREAGSYGSKVRGLNRLHQFEKVEIIQITTPETSYYYLDEMILHVKNILLSLKLPFRIIRLIGKNLGFSSSITYDFEVYSMAQKKWLEVSSVSNCTNYQSKRLNLRYKNKEGKVELCHTLNGSSLAIPRIMAALLENNQTIDQINIPKVLIPYTGFHHIK
ncbi:serine--tRNA ligase [Blattabacterium cuenoti]|uniref:serine--tRNA ligase n=1 Tax=Blattabacterium cuenoti TaxID=1653831 RepID=UPI00163CE112|nr:serine--tRNA ligase [Blattabacterium cuenoti]